MADAATAATAQKYRKHSNPREFGRKPFEYVLDLVRIQIDFN